MLSHIITVEVRNVLTYFHWTVLVSDTSICCEALLATNLLAIWFHGLSVANTMEKTKHLHYVIQYKCSFVIRRSAICRRDTSFNWPRAQHDCGRNIIGWRQEQWWLYRLYRICHFTNPKSIRGRISSLFIGVSVTNKDRTSWNGSVLFDVFYPYVTFRVYIVF